MKGLSHYKYIDALRGFAFLGVLSVHASQAVPFGPAETVMFGIGHYGVQLFFLLSAVTLLRSMSIRSSHERFPVYNFFIRRFFRIAPLFWSAVIFYFWFYGPGPSYWAPNGLSIWHYALTLCFLHGWAPTSINSVVPGDWSVGVEMSFYACLPFLAGRIHSVRSPCFAVVAALAGVGILNHIMRPLIGNAMPANEQYLVTDFLNLWFPSQLAVFFLGFLIYHFLGYPAVTRWVSLPFFPVLIFITAVFCLIICRSIDRLVPTYFIVSLIFGMSILALAARPWRLLVNPLTCNLGTISFSCYITHFFVLSVIVRLIKPGYFPHSAQGFTWPHFYFLTIWSSALIGTVCVSMITYNLIEKPGMNLGKMIIRSYERKTLVSSFRAIDEQAFPPRKAS